MSIAIILKKLRVGKFKSPSRLSTNYRNTTFGLLEAGTRVADLLRRFERNERTIHRFRQSGSKDDKPPSGRPQITTPLEVKVICYVNVT